MKNRTSAVVIVSLLILTGCQKENEPYLTASFSEAETTTTVSETTVTTVTTEPVYSYMDKVLFIGDRLCDSLSAEGTIYPGNIVSCYESAEVFADEAADMVDSGFSYIYVSVGYSDITSGNDPEKYADDIVRAAKAIREKYPAATVVILGNPPVKREVEYKTIILADTEEEKKIKLDTPEQKYNKALYKAAEASADLNIHFIDISVSLADKDGILSDKCDSGDGRTISAAGAEAVLSLIDANRYADFITWDDRYIYMYPDVVSPGRPEYTATEGKVVYLTFDDGPSKYTPEILDILARNDIKATFFVTGWTIEGKEDTLMREVNEGHTVGLHSWTHDYDYIYSSPEDFMDDFARVYYRVEEVTGKAPWAFRFPGGSYNNHNKTTADRIIKEMKRRGFEYFDWNCATSDAVSGSTYDSCIEEMKNSTTADHSVLLMHDAVEYTPQYLQEVIDYLRGEGYSFEAVDTADQCHFKH